MLHAAVDVSTEHEKGHAGNPINELADELCTLFAALPDGYDYFTEFTPAMAFAENGSIARWAFVALLPDHARQRYLVTGVDGQLYLCSSTCPIAEWGVRAKVIVVLLTTPSPAIVRV